MSDHCRAERSQDIDLLAGQEADETPADRAHMRRPFVTPPGHRHRSLAGLWHAAPMTSFRRLVSSGSPLEPEIGFSRAVRSGPYICVAGTAPIAEGGGTAAPGDVHAQSVRCLDIAEQALQEAGASLADVVRTRVMLTDIGHWREAARAHAQRFAQVRPACTFIEVSRFVDPQWLVEFELDAIVPG